MEFVFTYAATISHEWVPTTYIAMRATLRM